MPTAQCRFRPYFYPRPPRGGRRVQVCLRHRLARFLSTPSARRATKPCAGKKLEKLFLSTPSARRATRSTSRRPQPPSYFYPRPPRGGRRQSAGCPHRTDGFLSTPSARRATLAHSTVPKLAIFLSTPSARRATLPHRHRRGDGSISIHALREEGDLAAVAKFNNSPIFLSTPSARRATKQQSDR